MDVEHTQGANAFQAYDEGSIPFTRSNLRVFGAAVARQGLAPRRRLALPATTGHEIATA
jgi:hypothetical protein